MILKGVVIGFILSYQLGREMNVVGIRLEGTEKDRKTEKGGTILRTRRKPFSLIQSRNRHREY